MDIDSRIPVVGGLAYIERIRLLPEAFTASLSVEPDNRFFRCAIAVAAGGAKVGYVAPEVAPQYYGAVRNASAPLSCPARRGTLADHETSGVEVLIDLSGVPVSEPE